jgi:SH3-like domain-containing protein
MAGMRGTGVLVALALICGSAAAADEAVQPVQAAASERPRDPARGAVTNLPLPRYVTLKGSEGNARRGPSLTHRIDWTFTLSGMPLKITAEHENWRRVEDADGVGGWVHYALLSGTRSVLVTEDMAEFRQAPELAAPVVLQAEYGVVARLLECSAEWCRLSAEGTRGWVRKTALWGVEPGEIIE